MSQGMEGSWATLGELSEILKKLFISPVHQFQIQYISYFEIVAIKVSLVISTNEL